MVITAAAVQGLMMHGESSDTTTKSKVAADRAVQSEHFEQMLRVGPPRSEVIERPGYECRPMTGRKVFYFNTFGRGPSIVAIDENGVVWGPNCLVSEGTAGV